MASRVTTPFSSPHDANYTTEQVRSLGTFTHDGKRYKVEIVIFNPHNGHVIDLPPNFSLPLRYDNDKVVNLAKAYMAQSFKKAPEIQRPIFLDGQGLHVPVDGGYTIRAPLNKELSNETKSAHPVVDRFNTLNQILEEIEKAHNRINREHEVDNATDYRAQLAINPANAEARAEIRGFTKKASRAVYRAGVDVMSAGASKASQLIGSWLPWRKKETT